ncbi:c-type cytochrome [Histidinibacterium aquaticum]|nr:c-type cytochrome [Histidinibacterium aquaticum]
MSFWVRFVVGLVILGVIGVGAGFALMASGAISVAADKGHGETFYRVMHYAFKRSVAAQSAGTEVPENLDDEGRIALGAQHYDQVCSRCHGGPGLGQNPQALSMTPRPQHLPAVVEQFTDAELHWIVENGVMMSAMPAWPADGRTDEIWSVVAFLRQLPEMSAETYAELVSSDGTEVEAMPFGAVAETRDMNFYKTGPAMEEYAYRTPAVGWSDHPLASIPLASCTACHGSDGTGGVTEGLAPNLTIQSPEYLAATLRAYAAADRHSGFMQVAASGLSNNQIDALSTYFGETLPDAAGPQRPVDDDVLALGESIVEAGLDGSGALACSNCHSRSGEVDDIPIPEIAGQNPRFLTTQLVAFRDGGRGGTGFWQPMQGVAHEMSNEQIGAVAAYLGSLEPGATLPRSELTGDLDEAAELVGGVCDECHQDTMAGVPEGEYPNLTLQTGAYIGRQLHNFRTEQRDSRRMTEVAGRLSNEQIASLALYVDQLEPVAAPQEISDADIALGEQIANEGLPERNVPACLTCHGAEPTGQLPGLVRLHGQYEEYLVHRLTQFQSDAPEATISPMYRIADVMTPDEREAVSAWFASQEPLSKVDLVEPTEASAEQQPPEPTDAEPDIPRPAETVDEVVTEEEPTDAPETEEGVLVPTE